MNETKRVEPSQARPGLLVFSPTHRHKKTGDLYQILDVVIDATNGREGQTVVLYRSSLGMKFVRESTEFLDGRFEEVVL